MVVRTIQEIRQALKERNGWSLADESRDSRMFLQILDELAFHIGELQAAAIRRGEGA